MEYLDRLGTYREVHDKIVSLAQSSSSYNPSDAMDCSAVDSYGDECYDEPDVNAISKNHCARCDGYGHYAKDCATPASKGKAGWKSKSASKPEEDFYPGKGGPVCTHCKRRWHTKERCWGLYPGQKKSKGNAKASLDG